MKTLYVIDISSFIFRAFYAIRPLTAPDGEPTNALYGVASMLGKLIDEAKPEYLLVTYDSKGPSFREELDANYKANRSEPPEDLIPQFDRIEELIRLMGVPSIRQAGIEADDFIGTVTGHWQEQGSAYQVVIVSGDKDLMQLVNPQVVVWDTLTNKHYDSKAVEEKWGVPPSQIRDLLAITGDSSDNIPGIRGIGPKGAAELLKEYQTLEAILAAAKAKKITGKRALSLVEQEAEALLSQQLTTLKMDCDLSPLTSNQRTLDLALKFSFSPNAECLEFLKGRGFRALVEKWSKLSSPKQSQNLPQDLPPQDLPKEEQQAANKNSEIKDSNLKIEVNSTEQSFQTIDSESQLNEILMQIERSGEFAFDLETTSLNPRAAHLVGVAVCVNSRASYIPVGHMGLGVKQLDESLVLEKLRPIFDQSRIKKIGQNLKYDLSILFEKGITVNGVGADTMVASYLLEPEGRHNLETLARKYLQGYQVLNFEEVCGKGKNQITFDQVPIPLATRYSAEDAWIADRLWRVLQPKLEIEGLLPVFSEVDMPLVSILMRMEAAGVAINSNYLEKFSVELGSELKKIETKVLSYSKNPINLNSPKQLSVFLFEELNLPTQGKTKTGFSTDAEVLEALAPLHEVPRLLLEYREISKLKGTYVDPLPLLRDSKDRRIHAHFHQTVTATGRLSSSDPNLQNIPIRTERGKRVREAFISEPGWTLLSADYSQVELRILAHMSGDQELCRSFNMNEDVHQRTASEIFNVAPSSVNDEQRGVAKAINFGLMYGKTPFGLSQELGISRKSAQEMIERYFQKYKGVKAYLDGAILKAKENGYVTTLSGRKRRLVDIDSKNHMVRANAERMAMNSPIQGTAADMIKMAMIHLDDEIRERGLRSRLIIQVHDELVLEVPLEEKEQISKLVIEKMEKAMQLIVPLRVNSGFGKNWMEC